VVLEEADDVPVVPDDRTLVRQPLGERERACGASHLVGGRGRGEQEQGAEP
jgi:hypothetical protein